MFEYFSHIVDEDEVHSISQRFRNVFQQVLLIALRQNHRLYSRPFRSKNLLFDTADRQYLPRESHLAGHREERLQRSAGQQRGDRRGHGHTCRRTILRNRAGRHMDVDIVRIVEVRFDTDLLAMRSDP